MPSPAARRTFTLTGIALVHGALFQRHVPERYQLPVSLAADVGIIAIARHWGISNAELGLDPHGARRGYRVGMAALPVISAVVAAAAAVPAVRPFFSDDRAEQEHHETAEQLFVRIPIVTSFGEELLFRGGLLAVAETWLEPWAAAVWSSAVFGAWHVTPALESHGNNAEAAALARRTHARTGRPAGGDTGGRALTVAATVAATTAAGLVLTLLRRRSGSLVAPVIAHASVNGAALLAARWALGRAAPA